MWRVSLYSQTGEFVVAVVCLPLTRMPELLVWGERFFQLCDGRYREATAAVVWTEDQLQALHGEIDRDKIVDWPR